MENNVNRVHQRDCIEGMKNTIPNDCVDMILADPPYNIGADNKHIASVEKKFSSIKEDWDTIEDFENFNRDWISECARILKPGGSLLVWGTRHNIYLCGYQIKNAGLDIRTHYTWFKTNSMPCLTGRNCSESTEQLIWATKGKKWTYNLDYAKSINNGQNIRNVFTTNMTPPNEKLEGKHPSQKRLAGLTDHLVGLHSNPGDLILIPFCGSGTEVLAAAQMGRHFVAFELSKDYIGLSKRRLCAAFKGASKVVSVSYQNR